MATTSVRNNFQWRAVFSHTFAVTATGFDVASLVDGAGASQTLTVPGVVLGDMVIGRSLDVSTAGITVTADVTATDTVIVRFQNESGGTLDLASANMRLLIGHPSTGSAFPS